MAVLVVHEARYVVDGRELRPGLAIRRCDRVAKVWFEGVVGRVAVYDFGMKRYVFSLVLVVDGYAPSPLCDGDIIEILEDGEGDMDTERIG